MGLHSVTEVVRQRMKEQSARQGLRYSVFRIIKKVLGRTGIIPRPAGDVQGAGIVSAAAAGAAGGTGTF